MSGLTFTEDTARKLERLYLAQDVVAQRSETMKQLALSPGERVLDVGCGPGFLCESMAVIVGGGGAVARPHTFLRSETSRRAVSRSDRCGGS